MKSRSFSSVVEVVCDTDADCADGLECQDGGADDGVVSGCAGEGCEEVEPNGESSGSSVDSEKYCGIPGWFANRKLTARIQGFPREK